MDNLYIILAVLYVIYSIYRAFSKNKKGQAKAAPSEASPSEAGQPKPKSSFEDLLEEMLTGQKKTPDVSPKDDRYETWDDDIEPEVPVIAKPAESLETISNAPYFSYETLRETPLEAEVIAKHESSVAGSASPIHLGSVAGTRAVDHSWIFDNGKLDLRKAVIMSEILNRPYT